MLTKTLAKALAPDVRVNAIAAGDDYDGGRSAGVGTGVCEVGAA